MWRLYLTIRNWLDVGNGIETAERVVLKEKEVGRRG
jgi:hypothetical protein